MGVGYFRIDFQVIHLFRHTRIGPIIFVFMTRSGNGRARNIMRSTFLSAKEYRDFAAQCLRWASRAKREEHKNMMLQWQITGCRQRKQWSASTPAFHRARVWRRRRPRKTTLGKSRCRTISRVRVDDLLLAGAKYVRVRPSQASIRFQDQLRYRLRRHALDHDRGRSGRTARVSRPKHS